MSLKLMNPLTTTSTKRLVKFFVGYLVMLTAWIQRLKDMKLMQKDPNASDKARKAEQRANEKSGLITIKPLKLEGGAKKGGFKKGGFKSAFAPATSAEPSKENPESKQAVSGTEGVVNTVESRDSDDEIGYEYYNPRKPTGCTEDCGFRAS